MFSPTGIPSTSSLFFNQVPSAASIFSVYATLNAYFTLLQTIFYKFIPPVVRSYLLSIINRLFNRSHPSTLTLVIEEFEGCTHNPVYNACKTFLGTRISPSVQRLRVSQDPNENTLLFTLDKGQEIIDTFEEVQLRWRLITFPTKESRSEQQGERQALELSFENKYKEKVLHSYLPYVRNKAQAIKQENKELKLYTLSDYYHSGKNRWHSLSLDHPSTFDTLAMDPDAKKALIDDLDRFVRRKDFYKRVGKAWKRGYLLYGPPGTGKSSLIAAMANYLKFDVYDLELNSVSSDADLRKVLTTTTNRSILVMEDIDCGAKIQNRDSNNIVREKKYQQEKVSLSALLNFTDGIWSSCGAERIIVFTTNHKEQLDPALLRPGRMDMHINMSYCTPSGFKILASNYFNIQDDHPLFKEIEDLIENVEVTPAQIAEELMKNDDAENALLSLVQFLSQKKIEKDAKKDEVPKKVDGEEYELQENENEVEKNDTEIIRKVN